MPSHGIGSALVKLGSERRVSEENPMFEVL